MKIKALLFASIIAFTSTFTFAKHYFNVCYYNDSNKKITYDNNGISKKWLRRGELIGSGEIAPGEYKCFAGIEDETIFLQHYITFYVNKKWFGIANASLKEPYAISQDATAISIKDGKLPHTVVDNKDIFYLYIHVMPEDKIILSGSPDPKKSDEYISPRVFK